MRRESLIVTARRFVFSALVLSATSTFVLLVKDGLPSPAPAPSPFSISHVSRRDYGYFDGEGRDAAAAAASGTDAPAGKARVHHASSLFSQNRMTQEQLLILDQQEQIGRYEALVGRLTQQINDRSTTVQTAHHRLAGKPRERSRQRTAAASATSNEPAAASETAVADVNAPGGSNGAQDAVLLRDDPPPPSESHPARGKEELDKLVGDNYLGCFADTWNDRDLPEYFPSFTTHPAKCVSVCHSNGRKFAGLQDGGECWCGDDAMRHGKLPDSMCDKRCNGDPLSYCGGTWRNSVYRAVDLGYKGVKLLSVLPFDQQTAGSSVICQGHNFDTRVCKFGNLYYHTSASLEGSRVFIFFRGPGTIITNMDDVRNAKSGDTIRNLLEFSSLSGILGMDLVVVDLPRTGEPVPEEQRQYVDYSEVHVVPGLSSLFARFLPFNIMHVVHDDLLNLFMTMVEYSWPSYEREGPAGSGDNNSTTGGTFVAAAAAGGPSSLFDPRIRLVVVDGHGAGGYATLLQYLSAVPVTHISEIVDSSRSAARDVVPRGRSPKGNLVRFDAAVAGVTRHCSWYQYGFRIPQGPLEDKDVDGFNVRRFVDHVVRRLPPFARLPASVPLLVDRRSPQLPPLVPPPEPESGELVSDPSQRYAVIFSRSQNRKILNEPELAAAIGQRYSQLKVVIVRLEETPLPTILNVLARTRIAVGMHGSILILAMFMPKNSLLVEMFPYAVPADNYTPYRTMAGLKNMGMKYAAWMNTHPENNVAHPGRSALQGGIAHLVKEKQDEILSNRWVPKHTCCQDPNWLFRIYQDTTVHVAELIDIVESHGPW